MYPIREIRYEEIQNKKLGKMYLVVQITSVEMMIGEGDILEKSKIYIMYGLDILGKRTIIGIYIEEKEDTRYWIEQFEKIKQRGLKKILYVSTEKNKRLEQAIKIVYNPIIKASIDEKVEKIADYTQKRWKAEGERELVKAYLAETEAEYREKMEEIKEKYKENEIGMILIREFEKHIEKDIKEESKEVRHLISSYSTKKKMKQIIKRAEKENKEIRSIEELFDKKKEYFAMFERTRSYSKEKWTKLLNEIYKEKYEEIKEYV